MVHPQVTVLNHISNVHGKQGTYEWDFVFACKKNHFCIIGTYSTCGTSCIPPERRKIQTPPHYKMVVRTVVDPGMLYLALHPLLLQNTQQIQKK